tara:strand:- start:66 stop:407 length:342 start_codon:yes stop_codon:yes gene_type:complete
MEKYNKEKVRSFVENNKKYFDYKGIEMLKYYFGWKEKDIQQTKKVIKEISKSYDMDKFGEQFILGMSLLNNFEKYRVMDMFWQLYKCENTELSEMFWDLGQTFLNIEDNKESA